MFGELVCGPPGSGKTTYCEGKRQFLSVYDPLRPVTIVNLDPANEGVFPYPCDVDIRELVSHRVVMEEEGLGPNGTYLFCADVITKNTDWVAKRIESAVEQRVEEVLAEATNRGGAGEGGALIRAPYLLLDCPGQVEFYVNSTVMQTLVHVLQKRLRCSLCTVHLIDAGIATRDVPTYVSSCLLAMTTMVGLELPHINVLSKWDTLSTVQADIEEGRCFLSGSTFITEDFDRLWKRQLRQRRKEQRMAEYHVTSEQPEPKLDAVDRSQDEAIDQMDLKKDGGRMYTFSKALMEVVEGYGIIGFTELDIQSQSMMLHLTQEVDIAMGNLV